MTQMSRRSCLSNDSLSNSEEHEEEQLEVEPNFFIATYWGRPDGIITINFEQCGLNWEAKWTPQMKLLFIAARAFMRIRRQLFRLVYKVIITELFRILYVSSLAWLQPDRSFFFCIGLGEKEKAVWLAKLLGESFEFSIPIFNTE